MPTIRDNSSRWSSAVSHIVIWLLAAVLLGVVWWQTLGQIETDRQHVVQVAEHDLVNLARANLEHAVRTFDSADQVLRLIQTQYTGHRGRVTLDALDAQGALDKHIIRDVSIVDSWGVLRQSTRGRVAPIDLSSQEYFKAHIGTGADVLFISRPVQSTHSDDWAVQLSRRVSDPDGAFAGVVVVSLDPRYFTRFYRQIDLGPEGVVSLFGLDGAMRARSRGKVEDFVASVAGSPMFEHLARGEQTATITFSSLIDGIERTFHFRKLPAYPMISAVGMTTEHILAPHLEARSHWLGEAAVASFLLLALAATASANAVAERRRSAEQRRALRELQTFTNRVPGLVYEYLQRPNGSACFPFASDGIRDILRLDADQVAQDAAAFFALIHPDDLGAVRTSLAASAQAVTPWECEYRVCFADGTVRWVAGKAIPKQVDDGSVRWHGFMSDTTEQRQAAESLRIAATAFESEEGVFITDANGIIVRVNQAFSRITGYPAEEAMGKTPGLLKSGRHDEAFYALMRSSIEKAGAWQGEIWNRRKNGEIFPEWLNITAVKDESGVVTHYVSSLSDITRRKQAEAQIQNLAFYDPLTSLPNRRLFIDRLKQALASTARHKRFGALLFMDLDYFKHLNDTHGHARGDMLLQRVAERLNLCRREGDTVARLGGDEFVALLPDLGTDLSEAAAGAEVVAAKMLETLRQPYELGDLVHHGSASMGITLFSAADDSVDELLKRAELALYQAKDSGRNTLRFFDPVMQAAMLERAELEADLRIGLQEHQFVIYYQPQVNRTGALVGVEALVRWQHPRRGLLLPVTYIHLAEETGLILPLGQWVLAQACAQLRLWSLDAATANLTLAVNVSAVQFHSDDFVAATLATLAQSGAPPSRLKLELTESLMVKDMEGVIAKMQALKAEGVGFSLDDFGTGYSSLSYLKRLPLDQLKIDQSFLHEALSNPKDAAIVRATVALGKSLGLMVIAEGVETRAQRDFLESEGCDNYQGFYFGHPGPLAELARFLAVQDTA